MNKTFNKKGHIENIVVREPQCYDLKTFKVGQEKESYIEFI